MLCKAVLLQQARVEATRVVALKAQRELQLQQTKAVVAARGVKARVVRAATSTLIFLISNFDIIIYLFFIFDSKPPHMFASPPATHYPRRGAVGPASYPCPFYLDADWCVRSNAVPDSHVFHTLCRSGCGRAAAPSSSGSGCSRGSAAPRPGSGSGGSPRTRPPGSARPSARATR